MRHHLAAINDQLVLASGTFKEYRRREDCAHLLLINVHVYQFKDNDTAYQKETPLFTLDHLWATEPRDSITKGRELYKKLVFVGRVKPYVRSNGSKDYGIEADGQWEDLDGSLYPQVLNKIKYIKSKRIPPAAKAASQIGLFMNCIDLIKESNRHLVGYCKSPNEWIEFYTEFLEDSKARYFKHIKLEEKAERKERRKAARKRVSPHRDQAARGFA